MKTIDLSKYAPIISDKAVGEEIRNEIMQADPRTKVVEINMAGIISMTTYCAKQIFGNLYNQLGPANFERNIKFKATTEDVLLIVKMGIRNAAMESLQ